MKFGSIKKNNLFFAIQGKNTDGHKFAKEAIKKGAIKSVVSKKIKQLSKNKIIKVKNTFSSLKKLAKVTRDISSAQIIGITGSVGKTTLKNLTSFEVFRIKSSLEFNILKHKSSNSILILFIPNR